MQKRVCIWQQMFVRFALLLISFTALITDKPTYEKYNNNVLLFFIIILL